MELTLMYRSLFPMQAVDLERGKKYRFIHNGFLTEATFRFATWQEDHFRCEFEHIYVMSMVTLSMKKSSSWYAWPPFHELKRITRIS